MYNKLIKLLSILAAVFVVLLFLLYNLNDGKKAQLKVAFLDVGQGDSILIQTPFGQNILIDGGPDDTVLDGLSRNLPWWDRTIDLVILTHPHDDHVTGLNDVLKRYEVKKILYTGVSHSSPNYIAWLKLIRDKKVPVVIVDKPRKIVLGEDCDLDILYPRGSLLDAEIDNINNSSIVAKLKYKNAKFLLTGDIEKIVEEQLLASNTDLQAHVLKIAHHGSDTSSTEDFLKKVDPDITVISVGADNKFGHPNGRILKRLERLGVPTYRTDKDGEVDFTSDGIKIYKK